MTIGCRVLFDLRSRHQVDMGQMWGTLVMYRWERAVEEMEDLSLE